MDQHDIRDVDRCPLGVAVFGESVNLAALATYVRLVDLLDIGEDRTPYALWQFIAPTDPFSAMEWSKHRALSPVSVQQRSVLREVLVSGRTDDLEVFVALADLRSWVDDQFGSAISHLRMISGKYELDLDSRINWQIETSGFDPLTVRFKLDRSAMLGRLSSELYQADPLAFVRELLQNSVDAIDMREALLAKQGIPLNGEIQIRMNSSASGLTIDWADNGIGMDSHVVSSYFAKVGHSWYQSQEALRIGDIEPISRFGIGVLSCFAVSHNLTIETLIDPHVGGSSSGLVVEIPSLNGHFRVRTETSLPVGTTVRLVVPSKLAEVVSKDSVCEALANIARYTRHRVTVECDGVAVDTGFSAARGDGGAGGRSDDDLRIAVLGMRGDSAEKLSALTTVVSFEFGDPVSDYHGYYSAIVPMKPSEAMRRVSYKEWLLEGELIALEDVLVDTEQALFVKGIRAGPVTPQTSSQRFSLARYTDWIDPKLLLNVRRPSGVEFNLSRSSARIKSPDWERAVWGEIARKLKASAFCWPLVNPTDTALLLGSCATFGAVPDAGLDTLVGENDTPMLVVRAGEGPVWIAFEELLRTEEVLEAPFELAYSSGEDLSGFGQGTGLHGWG